MRGVRVGWRKWKIIILNEKLSQLLRKLMNEWKGGFRCSLCVWICGCCRGLNIFMLLYMFKGSSKEYFIICVEIENTKPAGIYYVKKSSYIMRQIFRNISSNLHKSYLKFYIQTHTHIHKILLSSDRMPSQHPPSVALLSTHHTANKSRISRAPIMQYIQ